MLGTRCFPLLSPLDFVTANDMRILLMAVLGLTLSACSLVFKLPTRQGNVIEQKQLDQLKIGMSRDQVTYLLGTPIAASPFRSDRWDYMGYYKSPRGKLNTRTVTLFFEKETLSRMEGNIAPAANTTAAPAVPDAAAIYKQQKKDKNEQERGLEPESSGVILSPQSTPSP